MTHCQYDKNLIDGAKSQSQIGVDLKRRPGWILRCISWCMLEWSKSKKGENSLVGTEIELNLIKTKLKSPSPPKHL